MTYCVGIRLEDGLVLASDTRTNAGIDHVSTARKLFTFEYEDRFIALQCAGNLATTQRIVDKMKLLCKDPKKSSFKTVKHLFEAAEMAGDMVKEITNQYAADNPSIDFSCSILLSGQIRGAHPQLYQIYPAGNFIKATKEACFLQIGESKYGKPVLDRCITHEKSLPLATKAAIISLYATIRSNLTVGMPIDILVYPKDSFKPVISCRLEENDEYYQTTSKAWEQGIVSLLDSLPDGEFSYSPDSDS